MNRFLLIIAFLFAVETAHAACPNIQGKWALTFDEVYSGDSYVGVGVADINSIRILASGTESYQGQYISATLRGRYRVNQKTCQFTWNYTNTTFGFVGTAHGVIVGSNKLFLIFTSSDDGTSGRAVAERMQ